MASLEQSGSSRSTLLLMVPDPRRTTPVREVLAQDLPAYEVETAPGPDKALKGLGARRHGVVILGGGGHRSAGLELLRQVPRQAVGIPATSLSGVHRGGEALDLAEASGCVCMYSRAAACTAGVKPCEATTYMMRLPAGGGQSV